ncbi:hypothetical protein [Streptomyces chilikensis]|uniref:Uncharacterized protein n=1 Tax=Streptomyces chilikensis TaxID=1194079 RepID=A0ABV3EXY8_9ACTN
MTTNESGPQVLESPRDRDDLAAGEAPPIVEEPPADEETGRDDDFAQLWAEARVSYFAQDFPKYASPAWKALHPDDPRRLAGALEAAEMWRKYGDEEALLAWFRDATRSRGPIYSTPLLAQRDAAAETKPPHQLQATPGWPPVRIPGKPGRYLTYQHSHQEAA